MRNLLIGAAFAIGICWPVVAVPDSSQVDLALVLAIDCSFSVDATEFRLQMQGLGQALQDELVVSAIKNSPHQRIAIIAFQWSDKDNQAVIIPWTVISGKADALAVGQLLEDMPRQLAEGGTSISNALTFANSLFSSAPAATRQVIDVSTDGRNNIGPPVPATRDLVVAGGVTINVLAIANEFPELPLYAERQISGGQGNFVLEARTYDDYGAAMLRKLIKEITGPGVT